MHFKHFSFFFLHLIFVKKIPQTNNPNPNFVTTPYILFIKKIES